MGNRVSYQVVNPPCPPKKDDKPKSGAIGNLLWWILGLFVGVPVFAALFEFAAYRWAHWLSYHPYRYYP